MHNPASIQSHQPSMQLATAAEALQQQQRDSTAVMTEEQHKQVMDFAAAAAGRDPSAVTFEEVQTAARTPPARKMFTVLHQDKAVEGRRRPAVNAIQWEK